MGKVGTSLPVRERGLKPNVDASIGWWLRSLPVRPSSVAGLLRRMGERGLKHNISLRDIL